MLSLPLFCCICLQEGENIYASVIETGLKIISHYRNQSWSCTYSINACLMTQSLNSVKISRPSVPLGCSDNYKTSYIFGSWDNLANGHSRHNHKYESWGFKLVVLN